MQRLAAILVCAVLMLGLTSLACLSATDVLESLGEPIPMATPILLCAGPFSWEPRPAVRIGTRNNVGILTLVVTQVIRPANYIADDVTLYSRPKPGEEFVAVDLTATCNLPASEACHLSTLDFGASGDMGISPMAEITMSGAGPEFAAGELQGGKTRSG